MNPNVAALLFEDAYDNLDKNIMNMRPPLPTYKAWVKSHLEQGAALWWPKSTTVSTSSRGGHACIDSLCFSGRCPIDVRSSHQIQETNVTAGPTIAKTLRASRTGRLALLATSWLKQTWLRSAGKIVYREGVHMGATTANSAATQVELQMETPGPSLLLSKHHNGSIGRVPPIVRIVDTINSEEYPERQLTSIQFIGRFGSHSSFALGDSSIPHPSAQGLILTKSKHGWRGSSVQTVSVVAAHIEKSGKVYKVDVHGYIMKDRAKRGIWQANQAIEKWVQANLPTGTKIMGLSTSSGNNSPFVVSLLWSNMNLLEWLVSLGVRTELRPEDIRVTLRYFMPDGTVMTNKNGAKLLPTTQRWRKIPKRKNENIMRTICALFASGYGVQHQPDDACASLPYTLSKRTRVVAGRRQLDKLAHILTRLWKKHYVPIGYPTIDIQEMRKHVKANTQGHLPGVYGDVTPTNSWITNDDAREILFYLANKHFDARAVISTLAASAFASTSRRGGPLWRYTSILLLAVQLGQSAANVMAGPPKNLGNMVPIGKQFTSSVRHTLLKGPCTMWSEVGCGSLWAAEAPNLQYDPQLGKSDSYFYHWYNAPGIQEKRQFPNRKPMTVLPRRREAHVGLDSKKHLYYSEHELSNWDESVMGPPDFNRGNVRRPHLEFGFPLEWRRKNIVNFLHNNTRHVINDGIGYFVTTSIEEYLGETSAPIIKTQSRRYQYPWATVLYNNHIEKQTYRDHIQPALLKAAKGLSKKILNDLRVDSTRTITIHIDEWSVPNMSEDKSDMIPLKKRIGNFHHAIMMYVGPTGKGYMIEPQLNEAWDLTDENVATYFGNMMAQHTKPKSKGKRAYLLGFALQKGGGLYQPYSIDEIVSAHSKLHPIEKLTSIKEKKIINGLITEIKTPLTTVTKYSSKLGMSTTAFALTDENIKNAEPAPWLGRNTESTIPGGTLLSSHSDGEQKQDLFKSIWSFFTSLVA